MFSRVSSSTDNDQEYFMLAIAKTSSYVPSNINLISTKKNTALFEPNVEEPWNTEKTGIKPKNNQEKTIWLFKCSTTQSPREIKDTKSVSHGEKRTKACLKTTNIYLVRLNTNETF